MPAMLAISCEKFVLPALEWEEESLLFAPGQGEMEIGVKSNVKWTVSYKDGASDDISFSPASGEGDGSVKIKVTASSDTVTLYVKSETLRKSLEVFHPSELEPVQDSH